MTIEDIFGVLIDAVKRMQYSKYQIDTFVVVDNLSDVNTSTFGATKQDYDDGHFWSRKYAQSGEAEFKADYPALWLEWKETSAFNYKQGTGCIDITLNVLRPATCTDCENKRSWVKTDILNEETLRALLRFVGKYYKKYRFNKNEVWLHEEVAKKMKGIEGEFGKFSDHLKDFSTIFLSKTGIDSVRSKGINFRVCGCQVAEVPFDLSIKEKQYPLPAKVGDCDTCD